MGSIIPESLDNTNILLKMYNISLARLLLLITGITDKALTREEFAQPAKYAAIERVFDMPEVLASNHLRT